MRGELRARQDVELTEPTAETALDTIELLADSLLEASGIERRLVDGVVLGVPGAVSGLVDQARHERVGPRGP